MTDNKLPQTPSQTIGPFFAYSLTAQQYGYHFNSIVNGSLINDAAGGEQIFIKGNVFDGEGNTIHDAMIELWQADENGNHVSEILNPKSEIPFKGFGRLGTGTDNSFTFKTIKPGSVNGQAPHINVTLFMRGSLRTLYTRIYFDDEHNNKDQLFANADAERRKTLIAVRSDQAGKKTYRFDIHMQGEKETIFFDV
jgi:protocatechuate 3,4-dioxygenase, alpha subunit